MAAGRTAGHEHEIGVAAVGGDVALDPGKRQLAVDDVLRPLRLRAQRVVGRHANVASLGKMLEHRQALLAFVPHHPGATVEVEQHRGGGRPPGSRLPIDVEAMSGYAIVGIRDVTDSLDALRSAGD